MKAFKKGEIVKLKKVATKPDSQGKSKSEHDFMQKIFGVAFDSAIETLKGEVDDMVKAAVQEKMNTQEKSDALNNKIIDRLGELLSREVPVPVAHVKVEPAKINFPAQIEQPRQDGGSMTLKGRITKRDQDGFMEDFELEIKR